MKLSEYRLKMRPAQDLGHLEKLLMTTKTRYQNAHSEAMMLKVLWTYEKTLDKKGEIEMANKYLKEATELVKNPDEPSEKALPVIRKGLHMNPHSHQLYALRGQVYAQKGDWQRATKWYETARSMVKFDQTSDGETMAQYRGELVNAYCKRGQWHENNERLMEAVADYEQVLVLDPKANGGYELQDMLLKCLRKLDKYDSYCLAWSEFVKGTKSQRNADLMTQHAEFKIHIREVAAARRMLRQAISLDKNNMEAQDLLQVIFDTGHTMLSYAIIWCINGCYDKALMTIDKGTDCDPYNPGFTVLKTIVLRLSGRLKESMQWLDNVNKAFYKLLEPSENKRGSLMGNLTVEQTRELLIEQWCLIRYDMAMEHMINGRYEEAIKVLQNKKLLEKSGEPRLLMGDCFMQQGKIDQALKAYMQAHEQSVATGCWKTSDKRNLLAQRITEILNSQSRPAIQTKQARKALKKSEGALKVLREENVPETRLGSQRSEALMYLARSHYQASPTHPTCPCLRSLVDSLSFGRGVDDGGIRNSVLGDNANLKRAIACFASKKKFPYCTKILMQN